MGTTLREVIEDIGGGIPNGKAEDPGTARVVKLGDDMISLDGDPVAINPPWLF